MHSETIGMHDFFAGHGGELAGANVNGWFAVDCPRWDGYDPGDAGYGGSVDRRASVRYPVPDSNVTVNNITLGSAATAANKEISQTAIPSQYYSSAPGQRGHYHRRRLDRLVRPIHR
jgi:hypothetical protein